jgi:hypothetical protein
MPNSDLFSFARNYPQLFHITRCESLQPLLESKGLLARPVWDFHDTAEYRHGLVLIRDYLGYARQRQHEQAAIADVLRNSYGQFVPDVPRIIDRITENLTYEIDHLENPRVKVYVACATRGPIAERMVHEYGEAIIPFNFMLPIVAYAVPIPFTSASLSRVTYDDREFLTHVPSQGFLYEDPQNLERLRSILEGVDANRRTEMMADWSTEKLCLFAPNIKTAGFSHEREWRLKSAISNYSDDPATARTRARHSERAFLGMAEAATFRDINGTDRYLQALTFQGQFISAGIVIFNSGYGDLKQWITQWSQTHQMPDLTLNEFLAAIDRVPESR